MNIRYYKMSGDKYNFTNNHYVLVYGDNCIAVRDTGSIHWHKYNPFIHDEEIEGFIPDAGPIEERYIEGGCYASL